MRAWILMTACSFPPPGQEPSPDPVRSPGSCQPTSGETSLGFTDVTSASGLGGVRTADTRNWGLFDMWAPGLVVADLSGDGVPDIFIPRYDSSNPSDAGDLYFENQGDGTFVDRTVEAGFAGDARQSTCAVVADYDDDEDLDLFVGADGEGDWLWQNLGDGTFADLAGATGLLDTSRRTYTAAFGRVDADESLDLYLGVWNGRDGEAANALFFGDGATFSRASGANAGCYDYSTLGVHFGDFDGDRDADLYVANDFYPDCLLVNGGDGTFDERAVFAGVADGAFNAMGVAVGDYDRDGDLDIYVTDTQGEDGAPTNPLWRNEGELKFTNQATSAGVEAWFSWGANFGDLDLDGDLDLYVGLHLDRPRVLYLGDGSGGFTDVAAEVGITHNLDTRGSVMADLDSDGDLEIVLSNRGGLTVYRNDLVSANHWLKVRAPVGSSVTVSTETWAQLAEVVAGTSYHSGGDPLAHLGLGTSACADVAIETPDGERVEISGVRGNQTLDAEGKPWPRQ